MHRIIDMKVDLEMVGKHKTPYVIDAAGVFKKLVWNEHYARGTFQREGEDFELLVTYIPEFHKKQIYALTLIDGEFSIESESMEHIAYQTRGILTAVEGESVEMAAIMMVRLIDTERQFQLFDLRNNLMKANGRLGQVVEKLQLLETTKEDVPLQDTAYIFNEIREKMTRMDNVFPKGDQ